MKIDDINIYCIAIPKRLKYIQDVLFNYYNFPKKKVNFINTVLKKNLSKKKLINKNIINDNNDLCLGKIACTMSHLKTMKQFLRSKKKYALILEDDLAKRGKNKYDKLINILSHIKIKFDILFLGRIFSYCKIDKSVNKWVDKTYYSLGGHSYIISRIGAQKILDYHNKINMLNDMYIAQLCYKKHLECYALKDNLFFQKRTQKGILKSSINHKQLQLPKCVNYKRHFEKFNYS